MEKMKGRVNTQLFYSPVHGWSVATTAAKFINAEWVWLHSQPTFFDGGMIFQIIRDQSLSKVMAQDSSTYAACK